VPACPVTWPGPFLLQSRVDRAPADIPEAPGSPFAETSASSQNSGEYEAKFSRQPHISSSGHVWQRSDWSLIPADTVGGSLPIQYPVTVVANMPWAMERLADSQPVMPENLTVAEMLARLAAFDRAQRRDLAWEWTAERDPEETVREILRTAASMSPRMRWLAADVVEEAGEEALLASPTRNSCGSPSRRRRSVWKSAALTRPCAVCGNECPGPTSTTGLQRSGLAAIRRRPRWQGRWQT